MDNASSDGTSQWLRAELCKLNGIARLSVRSTQETESVSRMWNLGLGFAWVRGYEQALVVNNDTELLPETYAYLKEALEHTRKPLYRQAGLVTCVSVRDRGQLVMPHGEEPEMRPHPDYSCFMLAKWAHHRVGFDEHCVGAFFEDNIHHVEMYRAGIMALNVGLPFLHHGSMTMKTADAEEKQRIERNAEQNRQYFYGKFGCYPGTKGYERLFKAG